MDNGKARPCLENFRPQRTFFILFVRKYLWLCPFWNSFVHNCTMKWIFRQFLAGPVNSLVYMGLPAAIVLHLMLYKTELSFDSLNQIVENFDESMIPACCMAIALSAAIFLKIKFTRIFAALLIAAFMLNTVDWMLRDIDTGFIGTTKQRIEDYLLFRLLALDCAIIIALPTKTFLLDKQKNKKSRRG